MNYDKLLESVKKHEGCKDHVYLDVMRLLEVDLPRIPHREMDFLIPDEIRLFLETAKEVQPDHYVLFLTAVMTGMRRGELLAMKWRNVDWQRRQYFV